MSGLCKLEICPVCGASDSEWDYQSQRCARCWHEIKPPITTMDREFLIEHINRQKREAGLPELCPTCSQEVK